MKPTITSIRYWTSRPRKKPKAGDRRTTKKNGLQVRVHQRHGGALMMGGGHRYYLFDWRTPAELVGTPDEHLLTAEERRSLATTRKPPAHLGGT